MASLDTKRLSLAFPSRPDLVQQIQAAAAQSPAHTQLFNDISSYVCDQFLADNTSEPAQKRRRVDGGDEAAHQTNGTALPARQAATAAAAATAATKKANGSAGAASDDLSAAAAEPVLLEVKDISVSIPQRKKYDLCFTEHYLYARTANTTAPVPGIVYAWRDIEHVFYLPVPEKAQVQYNYILFPRGAALAALSKPPSSAAPTTAAPTPPPPPAAEPLVFTVGAGAPKPGSIGGPSAGLAASVSDSYATLFHWAIEGQLRAVQNVYLADKSTVIVAADPKAFHSAARQPFRPAEKAVHVRAFRGSKDGYLFFLPTGILWAFKKPLLFLPLDRIVAVSYTNVLQRTFNIVVEVDVGGSEGGAAGGENDDDSNGNEEIEFGMLDQEDYNGISEMYVQRHRLQDRSMAERRKAKRELVENARGEKAGAGGDGDGSDGANDTNGANGDAAHGGGQEDDGLTELQRAEQQLQDEEDEGEEDYDPGSDGDSNGSGSSSEEEDEDGDEEDEDEEGGD
ncbi:hypothetical protein SCUCBS95973_002250 [Sporothrix curviconia]|uniref:Histone chaperone RTT106/FACT complex subunit SPT16-like middle domain-containing protein n=1 Tax=Sporothrix curviconia TaxID=1260050 RepID=A0ABP0B5E4_9PEZI